MKEYIEPIVEITLFTEDVVTTSFDSPMQEDQSSDGESFTINNW